MLIDQLIKEPEGKTLEFKRDVSSPKPLLKSLVAFANTAGGRLIRDLQINKYIINLVIPNSFKTNMMKKLTCITSLALFLGLASSHALFAQAESQNTGYRLQSTGTNQAAESSKIVSILEDHINQRVEPTTNCELPTANCNNQSDDFDCYMMMNPAIEEGAEVLGDALGLEKFREALENHPIAEGVFHTFQEETKAAKAATEAAKNSSAKIDNDFEEWLDNNVDNICFQLARVNASKDKADEILKVANINVVRCDDRKNRTFLDPEKFVDLICGLDFKKAIEEVNSIDHFLDDAKKDSIKVKNVIENTELVKKKWDEISEVAKKCSDNLRNAHILFVDKILKMENTGQYYNADKEQLLREFSIHDSNAANAYVQVIRAADDIFNKVLKIEDDSLFSLKEAYYKALSKKLEAKKSFNCADRDARDCLRGGSDSVSFGDKDDESKLNLSAKEALYDTFKEKRVECIKKLKIAKVSEDKLVAQLEKLKDNYVSLSDHLSDSFDSDGNIIISVY